MGKLMMKPKQVSSNLEHPQPKRAKQRQHWRKYHKPKRVLNNHAGLIQPTEIRRSFEQLFAGIPIGFYRSTPDGRFLEVNPAMVHILGYPDLESLLCVPVLDLYLNPGERLHQQQLLNETGVVPYSEIKLRTMDGRSIWVRDTLRLITNDLGEIEYEGLLEDINQRKLAEEALIQSEANLWAVLNNNIISYILIDLDLKIRGFNNTALESVRNLFAAELQAGQSFLNYLPEESHSEFLGHFYQALSGDPTVTKFNTIDIEGSEEWFEFHWSPAVTSDGKIIGICFTSISITSKQVSEQRIQHLYESEHQQRQIAEALQEAGQVLSSTLDVAVILDKLLEQVSKVINYDSGRVLLVENRKAIVTRVRGCGQYDTPELQKITSWVFDIDKTSNLKWIVENTQPLIIPDSLDYPGWVHVPGHEHIRAWIGIPIMAHGELIAIFSLAKAEPGFFTPEHARFLAAFAGQTALAMENAILFETVQRRARESETLRQAAAAVTTELDLDHVLDRILFNLNKVIQFDSAAILLLESDQLQVVAGQGFGSDRKIVGRVFPADNPLFRQSLTTGRPIILDEKSQEVMDYQLFSEYPIRGWLGVPLHLRGRAIGFLTVNSYSGNTYTESEATLAQAFANEATIALENARLFRELQSLATTDPLTKVLNRRHFIYLAKIEFQRARRFHQPLSAILFDIDSFKTVNDTYGHAVGDQVLQYMAKICQDNLRQIDLFGRYGGEEFMALLPNTHLVSAQLVAERLRTEIAQTPIPTDRGMIHISASFGVAEMDETCLDIDTLLLHADWATYASKSEGKNRVSVSTSEQQTDYYEFLDNK